jgi:hypothetical protein
MRWFIAAALAFTSLQAYSQQPGQVTIDITRQTNSFVPTQALGAGIDRLPAGAIDKLIDPETVKKVLSAGWQPVTYRQNTELFIEAWHWNPAGEWSEPGNKGYFTASAKLGEPIEHSYGYWLPHRGTTRNDGTTIGYSRITDGDPSTYWKSNPYLTKAFTGEDDSLHPQWIIIDLANDHYDRFVDAIRIAWAEPHATNYEVQYWTGKNEDEAIHHPTKGVWKTFPNGEVTNGRGGDAVLRLAPTPVPVRFLRVLMTESSNTCDTHGSSDRRNCVGYAINEIYLGTLDANGGFHDLMRHVPDADQTITYASSNDPWHSAEDIDPLKRDQVGFDLFYHSGYTRGLPAIVPIAMVYDIPESAANEIAYLKARGYPVSYVEMGEEPDGQFMEPEDYAALYIQWAKAIHAKVPEAKLGGPVFTGENEDIETWPDAQGKTSWTQRFIDYLKSHGALSELAFFSFEHYPLEPCKTQWSDLYREPHLVTHIMDVWREDGVPANVPLIISESNIDWQGAENAVDIFGALWLDDYIGSFLTHGGNSVYWFHYAPLGLHAGCDDSYFTFGLFTVDANLKPIQPVSQYFGAQMLNLYWVEPGNGVHKVFPAWSDIRDDAGNVLVTAYALQRPDGQWSVMLINKDQESAHTVRIAFRDPSSARAFSGAVKATTFGAAQYQWHPTPTGGGADPDGPPVSSTMNASATTGFTLPKASVTVLAGKLAP